MICSRLLSLFVLVATLGFPWIVLADQDDEIDLFEDLGQEQERFDQRTPMATARGFMRAAEIGDYDLASTYLDLRYLPETLSDADGALLAEQLYIVVSRKVRIEFESLSDDVEGLLDDGLPSYRDELGEIATARGARKLYLQRVPGAKDRRIWRVSNATVAQVPELYEQYGYGPLVEKVRQRIPDGSFLGAELFKWVFAILAGSAAMLAWLALTWPIIRLINRYQVASRARVRQYLTRPIAWTIFILVGYWALRDLGLGVTASRVAQGGTLATIVIVWLLFATVNLFRDLYVIYLQARGRDSGLMLMRPVTSTIKVVIALLAITIWLDNIGVNVTALVAGLGVGGLAVALVLQKPLEDILGAVTLYTQQPVSIGQFCTTGNVTGTIEEISLRSTRIRKPDNNVVIVPNSIFATASILNASEKQHTLHRQTLRLALETTETQIRVVLEKLRELLGTEPKVAQEQWRARFVEFGEFSKNIDVFAHITTADWKEFLEVAEVINLKTVGVLETVGVKLAEPPR